MNFDNETMTPEELQAAKLRVLARNTNGEVAVPDADDVEELIGRWEGAIPDDVELFRKHGTLHLQAQYRLMLVQEQYENTKGEHYDALSEAERAHLLMC
ncbi:MAG: hypothetical protein AB8B63_06480 [Granulosicoccus sp.]